MQIVSVYTLSIGKFLNGFFVTVVQIAQIKMINETVPVYLIGAFAPIVDAMISFGYTLVFGFGKGLPQEDYNPELTNDKENLDALEANKNDNFWRVIYLFPMLINCFMLASFMLFIRNESIMFCLSEDRDEDAKALIDKVYHKNEDKIAIL